MKVVMINDCAYVGETMIKFFLQDTAVSHLKRSRGLWEKTFGLTWKILKSKGELYHVHYLLQDCYLALKFGKHPIVGHAHGSDLRRSLKHKIWYRIVKYNLQQCDKVLVSTPDILEIAKKYRADAEYLPNPVDTTIFHPKPLRQDTGKLRVLLASGCDWALKGTDKAIKALGKSREDIEVSVIRYGVDFNKTLALAQSLGLHLNVLPPTSHENISQYYWSADIVLDQFEIGTLGMIALEAIACGRPVFTYISPDYEVYADFPLKEVNSVEAIIECFEGSRVKLWQAEHQYLYRYHKPEKVAKKVSETYDELLYL